MTLRKLFGANLKHYRCQLQLTQEQLAERCNVTTETISNIERALKTPRFELIEQIAEQLNVQPFELFKPANNTPPHQN